ncbi:MAG TPA: hypothetical protein VHY08_29115, partial [Bacillota bacterium]|nr:hypothetical protein [Bacillota bacterium]
GQLGNNDALKQDRNSPVQVVGVNGTGVLSNIQAIATGMGHTVALGEGGFIYSWGNNAYGQLGDGIFGNIRLTPVTAQTAPASAALGTIKAIAAGDWHTMAQKDNGEIYAWGDNAHGQLSQPISQPLEKNFNEIPTLISGHDVNISGALAIDAGSNYSAVLLSGGKVCGWGGNGNGELGIEATDEHEEPMYAHLPSGVTVNFFSAGTVHMLAVTPGGALYVWGSNYFGQLGIGGNTNSLIPKLVNF